MVSVRNAKVLFVGVPQGYPVPGKDMVYDTSDTIDVDSVSLQGGVLIKTLILSSDPYLRERMHKDDSGATHIVPSFTLNQLIVNFGVGIVLKSEAPQYKPGDHVYGIIAFQEYILYDFESLKQAEEFAQFQKLPSVDVEIPLSAWVGPLGMPGQTAYYGWKEFAEPQKGDVVFVTTAAGIVGSFVLQLAKAAGCKVIASAGSEEKVEYARSLGADVAFNYKTTSTAEVLQKEGPIDIYWDNVGGEQLEHAFAAAARGARFLECGWITAYNSEYKPVKNVHQIFVRTLKVYGVFHTRLHLKYVEEFFEVVPRMVARGEIRYAEDFKYGLEHAMEAIVDVQTGKNKGKSVIVVAKA